jgi:uncharacterized protein YbjT (DUF2867 family)
MRVLVCGSTGCIGSAVASALRGRGHVVIEASRRHADGPTTWKLDFMTPCTPSAWAGRMGAAHIDAVVNCVGILMPSPAQSFERVHSAGPVELFEGAALAGVTRIVQISALGVGHDGDALAMPYLHSKLRADDALATLRLEWAVLRPSLVYGPRSQSAALFALLASLPVIALPGRGAQRVQPIHVYELAEAVARQLERDSGWHRVHELGGPQAIGYRDMLAAYRAALGRGPALWLPLPLVLMRSTAWAAEALPQRVFCRDTLRLLERGSLPAPNGAHELLGRAPTTLARGLAITPVAPLVDLHADLSPAVDRALRATLGFMWIYTALISAWMPQHSGVLALLARCGFQGGLGVAMLIASCTLNLALGMLTLLRPTPSLYALQAAAVLGYTTTAALNMPELALDHCGPLVKNLPVLGIVLLLWSALPTPTRAPQRARRMLHTLADGAGGASVRRA